MTESRLIGYTVDQYKKKVATNGPIVQPAQTAQATSYSPTELKAISGGADPNATDKNGNLVMGTTTTPTTPLRASAGLRDTGMYDPTQSGLDQANADQNAYYVKNGTTDPGIEANIVNLQSRLKHLQNGGDSLPSGVEDPILRAQLSAANAAEAKSIQDQLANIQKAKNEAAKNAPTGQVSPETSTNPLLAAAAVRKQARLKGQPLDAAGVQNSLHPNQTQLQTQTPPTSVAGASATDGTTPLAGQTAGQTGTQTGTSQTTPQTPQTPQAGQEGTSTQQTPDQKNGVTPPAADPFITSITSIIGPELALGIQETIDSATKQKADILAAVAEGKIDQETAIKALGDVRDETIKAALDHYGDQLDFNAKQDAIEKQAAEDGKKDSEAIVRQQQNQADLNGHISYHNQEIQNTETEMQNRNAAAKLGINFDTGGLKWMQTQQQKGVDALNFISQQMALNDVKFSEDALKVVRDYTYNTMVSSQNATQRYNQAWKDFNDSKRTAKSDYSTGVGNQKQFYATLNEKYVSDVKGIDQELGNTYKSLADNIVSVSNTKSRVDAANTLAGIKQAIQKGQFDIKDYEGLSKERQDAVDKMAATYNKETEVVDFNTFSTTASKLGALVSLAETNPSAVTGAQAQELFAQFGQMKPTSRMPVAMVKVLQENMGTMDNIRSKLSKIQGKGAVPVNVLNDMVDFVNAVHPALKQAAIAAQQQYILQIAQYNQGLLTGHPNAPETLKIDASTVFPGNLYTPKPSQTSAPPEDIFHGKTTYSPQGIFSPTAMRTDRNNNPIAAAMNGDSPNQFTKALDKAGIAWEAGDPFPGKSSSKTIRIKGNPIEGARAILSDSNAIQNWYINHTGSSILPKYGVKTNDDFKKLPSAQQDAIIQGIYQSEGGDGSLFAQQTTQPNMDSAVAMMQNDLLSTQ